MRERKEGVKDEVDEVVEVVVVVVVVLGGGRETEM